MGLINKYKWLIMLVIVAAAGVSLFLHHFYDHGIEALLDFSASYEKYHKAISEYSMSKTDDLESKAGEALGELQAKASFRLSSLIKNDGALMDQAREVADLSRREFESLRVYKRSSQRQNAGLEGLAREYGLLNEKRKGAYARFQELGGKKDGIRD